MIVRLIILIQFLFLSIFSKCQERKFSEDIGFGLECQLNYAQNGYQVGAPFGVQAYFKWKQYEIYGGCGFYRMRDEEAKTFPLEIGLKLHKPLAMHWNEIYFDLNFQHAKWSGGTIYNLRHDYVPPSGSTTVLHKSISTIISISPAYRIKVKNIASFSFSLGPGLCFYDQKEAYVGLTVNANYNKKVCNVILLWKAVIRLQLKH